MTNEPSPRPWRVAESVCGWQNCIEDANGNDIGSCWYNRDRLRAEADAALIVAAVNERDRLRDIVRRMVEKLAVLNAGYRLMLSEGPEDAEMADLCARTEALVSEARAAIGEGETPTGKGVGE